MKFYSIFVCASFSIVEFLLPNLAFGAYDVCLVYDRALIFLRGVQREGTVCPTTAKLHRSRGVHGGGYKHCGKGAGKGVMRGG